jgi:dolichol-phosphate mannosyltransferase
MKSTIIKRELVSVVVPIFNEEDGVLQLKQKLLCLRDLLSDDFDVEFVFVDDGSRDSTVPALNEHFKNAQVRYCVVEHGVNRGVGAAFRTGFQSARGSYICTIDADCSYSPEGLKLLLTTLRMSGDDIAVASPYHPDGGVEGVPAWRLVLSKGCSALYRLLSPLKLHTYTSIFRVYREEVVRRVPFKSDGFVSASEILIGAGRRGYTVVEVPMVLRARAVGRSKMKVARTTFMHFKMLFGFFLPSPAPPPASKRPVTAMSKPKTENVA